MNEGLLKEYLTLTVSLVHEINVTDLYDGGHQGPWAPVEADPAVAAVLTKTSARKMVFIADLELCHHKPHHGCYTS